MANTVDLNSDLGEGFGAWKMGDDAALMDIVSSANIACGFHAGDQNIMARTMEIAVRKGTGIGAHPGFPDLAGFGRRRMNFSAEELSNMIGYQLGAAQAMARLADGSVRHLKLHGALGNIASEDISVARACFQAALAVQPDIILMAIASTAMEQAAKELDCTWVGEIYADREYEEDGTLVDRKKPGAVIEDADYAAERILKMLKDQAVITKSGKRLPCRVDTVCLHGDTSGALAMGSKIRSNLIDAGVSIRMFGA
ncbi:LamB/YcsF family protein [Phaeobacter gallaeciensis]|uniref:5-oxoprolinase subunit A n=1 Tax=Phaeobacter gallaeciensis TaxID=60890 RepID=A0AAC9ZD35_9RHOB|nr:5-oxoprolinase subunit PxpA [Phaeobacter gallaeciensis]AHD11888.1 Uncharacterized protein, similar to lactam utilization protein B [Phaeobacter gallaeciensis DSM 26640]ATE95151.1 putative protein, similar to lactam utilization protein B [Phaeobacter gallaeciensis]ATE99459.1 putative protein, similar to lactam utilization protein B [Phaeobacter gallaeciensis]ATF03856.1 putative protein, similar to lactam utilization protein B [Phaeobacter gallaeciensis]ATF08049.1 putative protein, similar to